MFKTFGAAASSLQKVLKDYVMTVKSVEPFGKVQVEIISNCQTLFISWCHTHGLCPVKTRNYLRSEIRNAPQFRPYIERVTDYIALQYNVRGVWTP